MAADILLEEAENLLGRARNNLRQAEAASYCCDVSRKHAISLAKKEVKRWETWIADYDALEVIGQM